MQPESPHLQLCPGDLLPTLLIATVIFKDAPREQCVFETTWIGYVTEHHYDLYYKCLRFWQMGTLLWPPRTSSCMYISLLIKLTAYPSRVAWLFLLPLLVSTVAGEQFQISLQERPMFWAIRNTRSLSSCSCSASANVPRPRHYCATSHCCHTLRWCEAPSSLCWSSIPYNWHLGRSLCAQKHNLKFVHFDSFSLYFSW